MKKSLLLPIVLCCVLCAWTLQPRIALAEGLGVGSPAPPLNIEHWLQDGNGFFSSVETFEEGNVYVVEFWATWCGPCIESMPHLAELQNKYRGRDVQIISVSDETVDEVEDLLAKENEKVGKTFSEITSAYSLTADPDRSVHEDYMEGANQQGIPTSFIVGKSGLIEWIGHPMELDEPLDAVVTDSWDREKFKEELRVRQEFEENVERITRLAGSGKFVDALKLVDAQLQEIKTGQMRQYLVAVRNSLKLSGGLLDDDALAYYRSEMKKLEGDAYAIGRFGFQLYGQAQQGADLGVLGNNVVAAIEREMDEAEEELKPLLYNTIALLNESMGKTDEAIKAQQAAIDATDDDRRKARLMPLLEKLKKESNKAQEDNAGDETESTEAESNE